MPETTVTIRPEFATHTLNEEGLRRSNDVRRLFTELLNNLESHTGTALPGSPNGRHVALMRTELERAAMFAQRAIATDPSNQA